MTYCAIHVESMPVYQRFGAQNRLVTSYVLTFLAFGSSIEDAAHRGVRVAGPDAEIHVWEYDVARRLPGIAAQIDAEYERAMNPAPPPPPQKTLAEITFELGESFASAGRSFATFGDALARAGGGKRDA